MLNLLRHWIYISTKGQVDLSSKATRIGLPFTYLSIFFSESTGLFELKFHMEYSVDAKWRNLKSEQLSSTSVRKECLPKEIHDLTETLGKESPSYSTVKKWAAEFKRGRESVEDDGRSGHTKYATADENVMVVHTLLMFDRRGDLRSGYKFWSIGVGIY